MLQYFYGQQSEQFSFYRIPKLLVKDRKFAKISMEAKFLYGILSAEGGGEMIEK